MTEQITAEPQEEAVDIQLPGIQLRAERERRHWTQEEVAVKLHLKVSQIDALERDAYERFAAPIFVSGYLRNYARLLKLPPEPMLAAFDRQSAPAPGLVSDLTMQGPRMPTKVIAGQPATLLLAVGAGLIVLGILWWIMHDSAEQAPQTAGGNTALLPSESAPTELQSPGAQLPEFTSPGSVVRKSAPPVSIPQRPSAPASTPLAPAGPTTAASDIQPAPSPQTAPGAGPSPSTLVLHYQEDSWTAVTDAAGDRLLYKTGKAGETLRVSGPAPFDVVLGNARGVTIEYNGKSFRHPRMNRPDVAKFHIAGASD